MRERHRQHGFVLVMVLLLLAIVSTTVAAVSRRGLDRALQAESAETDLQRRWAVVTARHTLLPNAEMILTDAESQARSPVVTARSALRLGRLEVEFALGDEQAKASADTLYRMGGLRGADRHVRALIAAEATGSVQPVVDLRPQTPAGAGGEGGTVLGSFAQLFRGADPAALMGDRSRPGAAEALTCWGDGRLNLRRASEQSLAAVCEGVLTRSEVHRLIALRADRPNLTVHEAIERMQPTGEQANLLGRLLNESSNCHSLWIAIQEGRRTHHTLLVLDRGRGATDGVVTYDW